MKLKYLDSKDILILGLGITGYETAQSLKEYKDNIILVDNNIKSENAQALRNSGFTIKTESEVIADNPNIDIILKSPGIPFENDVLMHYKDAEIINDIELADYYIRQENLPTKIIALTGTNGKTTGTMFLVQLLKEAGFNAEYSGNIGVTPLEMLSTNSNLDYLILELSSFQLKSIKEFAPHASFVLNISPDHLDYHKTYKDYVNSKLNIFKNQKENSNVYLNSDIFQYFDKENLNLKFNDEHIDILASLSDAEIAKYKANSVNFDSLKLFYKFAINEGVSKEQFLATCDNFKGVEHRIEFVDELDGIKYYNDSKATNLEAMGEAVNKFDNIVLLVGGSSKGEDLSNFDELLGNVKAVVAYGENKDEFNSNKVVAYVDDLESAFKKAQEIAEEKDVILLSPASASFDQYKDYVERGLHFKSLIKGE